MAGLSVHTGLLALSAGVTAGLAVQGWRRRPDPGAAPFAALMLCATVWTACYGVAITVPPGQFDLRLFWERLMMVGAVTAPVPWLVFALEYSGAGVAVTRRRLTGLLVVPVVTLLGVWTNPAHGLVWTTTRSAGIDGGFGTTVTVMQQSFGPLFWLNATFAYTLILVGTVLLVRTSVTDDYLYADQAVALVVGAVVPAVANAVSVLGGVPALPGIDLTPYAFTVTGIAFGNALFRYRFMDRLPATRRVGRDTVVRNMRDGVLVVDEGVVVDANDVAERVLGDSSVGEPLSSFSGVLPAMDGPSPDALDGESFDAADGSRFEVRVSSLVDDRDRSVGKVVVLRDVTDRHTREQRLKVLNRLLRHNFRNDLTVVRGYAELLDDELDGRNEDLAGKIHETSSDLIGHANKARDLEELMESDDSDARYFDLERALSEAADLATDRDPNATASVDVPPGLSVAVPDLFRAVVENLAENAVDHHDGDPRVELSARRTPGGVEVTVADDGPGIPDYELDVLEAGTETPLEHGSGVGLWIVRWGVEELGGEIEFEANDPRGTVARIRIPGGSLRDEGVSTERSDPVAGESD